MDQLKHILVGVDFSPCCAAALRQAVRIAGLCRADVSALHVVDVPVYALPEGPFLTIETPPIDLLLTASRERWAEWSRANEIDPGVRFDTALGFPRLDLIERVRRDAVDLLVIGANSDSGGLGRVGSTASACVQRAPSKVLVVREGQATAFRRVAACIDFSATSRIALEQAIRIATLDGAELRVLHIFADPWRGLGPLSSISAHMPDFPAKYRAAVEVHMRKFCDSQSHELGALKAEFHPERYDQGGHGKGIVEFVTRERCDLVVLGTKSKWSLHDFVWGSTAERVVCQAPCGVLTVKPASFNGC